MTKRAEDVAETRRRIVRAAVDLHGTLGPARTTVAAIAARAGVTRLTVYRHFADDEELFGACSAAWYAGLPHVPDPQAWREVADPLSRLRAALADVYPYYRAGADMLVRVTADWEAVPESVRSVRQEREQELRALVLGAFRRPSTRLRAAVGHAMAFSTWRSLCLDQGLTDRDAIELMVDLVAAAGTLTR